ncbi:MAG: lactate utilization protein [Nitrososphaerota archaeon]
MKAKSGLVQKFMSELDKLGATGKLFGTHTEVIKYIEKLVIERKAKLVLMSGLDQELSSELSRTIASAGASCFDVKDFDGHELRKLLEKTDIGITDADLAVAETGSLVLTTRNDAERLLSCLPPIHVAILTKGGIVDNFLELAEWFKKMQDTGTHTVSVITGPSRTADIELEIVVGVHGPHELHVIVLEEGAG